MSTRTVAPALLAVALLAGCSGEPATDRAADGSSVSPSVPRTSAPAEPEPTRSPARPAAHPVLEAAIADGPVRATTPRQVAEQIRVAEAAIADPGTPPRVLEAAGKVQQLAYRVLGQRPGWDRRVYAALPRGLHRVVELNLDSRRQLRSMHPASTLSDTLPAWRIVAPPPAARLKRHYLEAQRRFGVDWEYLAAVNMVETVFGRIRGTSVAGAQGPMQFMPGTWAAYGRGDVDDPHDAIMAAGRYLDAMGFSRSRSGALYRYNNSDAYVRAVTDLARVMQLRPRAFLGYYHWDVWFLTSRGEVMLPVGYHETEPVPVEEYLAGE